MYSPEELADILGQHRPTAQQSAVISSPMQPALVVAGAGSGKTATMADRVVWLLANGLARPENILGVTFTRKAAGELQARIGAHISALRDKGLLQVEDHQTPLDPEISTYHSYANRIVSDYGIRLGIEPDATMLGAAQSYQVVSRLVDEYQGDWQHLNLARSSLIAAVLAFSSECAEHLVDPGDAEEYLAGEFGRLSALPQEEGKAKAPTLASKGLLERLHIRITVSQLAAAFAARKAEMGVLDYGDLVRYAAELATTVPAVRDQERERFSVVLLDEFQDTSHAQLSLFSSLFSDAAVPEGNSRPPRAVMAVGDPNQSIYGFRGASAGQLFSFAHAFPVLTTEGKAVAPTYFLSTAWRNSIAILNAANAVSAPLRLGGSGSTPSAEALPELQPRPGAPEGVVFAHFYPTQEEEAAALADQILALKNPNASADGASVGELPDTVSTMAILCRQRSQFAAIAPALQERGISYEIVGLGGLIAQPEIVDLMATMHLLVDPSRSDALMRLMTGARWRIGPADLMALSDWARELSQRSEVRGDDAMDSLRHEHSIVDAISQLPPEGWVSHRGRSLTGAARERLQKLHQELSWLRTRLNENLLQLVADIERTMLLDIEVAAKPGVTLSRARLHLDAFYEEVANFVRGSDRVDLAALLAWLEDVKEQEQGLAMAQEELDPSAVQIMTVHASKGLEWDAVFVPGLVEGSFPTAKSARWSHDQGALPWPLRGDRADLPSWNTDQPDLKNLVLSEKQLADDAKEYSRAEERRLAYVAYTRARNYLWLSGARTKLSAIKPLEPSAFFRDAIEALELSEARKSVERALEIEQGDRAELDPIRVGWPYDPLEGPLRLDTGQGVHPLRGRREPMEAMAQDVLERLSDPQWSVSGESALLGEAEKLLALRELQRRQKVGGVPEHLRASDVVEMAEDPEQWIRQQRRKVPRRPSREAKAGTAFHAWVENYFASNGGLELGEFVKSVDADLGADEQTVKLQETFKASEWADRQPAFVEYPIETAINGRVIRGRIDAVFQNSDGSWELVDWKSGQTPAAKDLKTKSIQLALYRLAWARLQGIDPQQVSIAFYYVGSGETVRPTDLHTESELEEILTSST